MTPDNRTQEGTKSADLSPNEGVFAVEDLKGSQSGAQKAWIRWLPLGCLIALMGFGFAQGWHQLLTLDSLVGQRAALQVFLDTHYLHSLLVYMAGYAAVVAISLPGAAVLTILGGLLFGWLVGGVATVVAATLGATVVFLIARSSFGTALRAKAGPMVTKIADGFQEDAFHYLLFLRLVPIFPFWLINLAPALLGVSTRHFVLGTMLGILPATFAFAFIGSGLDSVIEAQRAASGCAPGDTSCQVSLSLSALVTPQLLIAFAALGVVALIPPSLKYLRGSKTRTR